MIERRAERGEPTASHRELCEEFGWLSTGAVRVICGRSLARATLSYPGLTSARVSRSVNELRAGAEARTFGSIGQCMILAGWRYQRRDWVFLR